jgi:dTDP-4-dehydrorhamnose reductase
VGSQFVDLFQDTFEIIAPSHNDLNILDTSALEYYFQKHEFDTVINFTGITNVDVAEPEKNDKHGLTYQLNVVAVKNLASITKKNYRHLIHLSTDYVFDGKKSDSPYTEDDTPNPISWYGQTKYQGEQAIADLDGSWTIVRIMMPYGSGYQKKSDFARFFVKQLQNKEPLTLVADQKITPIFIDDAVTAIAKLCDSNDQGIYHVASLDWITPIDFGKKLAQEFGFDQALIKEPISYLELYKGRGPRPQNSWLNTQKFDTLFPGVLHTISESLRLFKKQVDVLQKT